MGLNAPTTVGPSTALSEAAGPVEGSLRTRTTSILRQAQDDPFDRLRMTPLTEAGQLAAVRLNAPATVKLSTALS